MPRQSIDNIMTQGISNQIITSGSCINLGEREDVSFSKYKLAQLAMP